MKLRDFCRVLTLTILRVKGFKWPLTEVTEIQICVGHVASSVVFIKILDKIKLKRKVLLLKTKPQYT